MLRVEVERGKIMEPRRCTNAMCNLSHTMVLQHNFSEFKDRQYVKVQESSKVGRNKRGALK